MTCETRHWLIKAKDVGHVSEGAVETVKNAHFLFLALYWRHTVTFRSQSGPTWIKFLYCDWLPCKLQKGVVYCWKFWSRSGLIVIQQWTLWHLVIVRQPCLLRQCFHNQPVGNVIRIRVSVAAHTRVGGPVLMSTLKRVYARLPWHRQISLGKKKKKRYAMTAPCTTTAGNWIDAAERQRSRSRACVGW